METIQSITDMVRPGVMLSGVIAFVSILLFVMVHLESLPAWRRIPLMVTGCACLLAAFKAGVYPGAIWTIMAIVCVSSALTIALASSFAQRKISQRRQLTGHF